jgi:hypothetical protein
MLALKYLLMILGVGLFGSAGALIAYDIFLAMQLRRLLHRKTGVRTAPRGPSVTEIGFPGCAAGQGLR